MPGRLGQREIAVTGVENQTDVAHEIVDQDAALRDLGIVSPADAASTAWRSEHWPPLTQSPEPAGSPVSLTTIVFACAAAASTSSSTTAISGAANAFFARIKSSLT